MAEQLVIATFALIASKIAGDLLSKKQHNVISDEKPTTSATRGSYIPIIKGRRRVGPHVAWVGKSTPYTTTESNNGGKGVTGNGSQQIVYHGDAHHVICVGPGEALHTIWSNGKIVYNPAGGINRQTHTSGTNVVISGFGTFTIYWGEADQPVDAFLADPTRIGVASRWKFCMRIVWRAVRLGGFPTWPSIEYEPEVRPYKPGMVVGVNQATLPERLAGSNGWLNNEVGADPASIFGITDGFTQSEIAGGGTIKVAGDHTVVFPSTGKARVVGQPYAPFVNSLLSVSSSIYNSGETYYTTHGYVDTVVNYVQALTDATWVKTNVTISSPTSMLPPAGTTGSDQTRYQFTNGGSFPNTVIWNAAHVTTGDRKIGRFRNRVTFFVYRFGQSGVTHLKIGMVPFTTGPLVEHYHQAQMDFIGGQIVITNSILNNNGKLKEILPPLDTNWRRFEFSYTAGHGTTPSDNGYNNQVYFDTTSNTGNLVVAAVHLERDNGISATGVTTIDFIEALDRIDDTTGTIQAYLAGQGPGGANAAHLIDEFLFETFPHGAGLDRSVFDIPSLEALGNTLEISEGLRSNTFATEGREFESVLAAIFFDIGMMISWDRTSGLFVFVLIRDPNFLPSIPYIPEELIADPLPERIAIREQKTSDKAIFGFSDVALGYRDNVAIADDDGRASIDQNQKSSTIQLETAIDAETAVKIAERRAQEVLVPISKFSLTVLREAGDFYPGNVTYAFDFYEVLRIIEVKVDPKTRRTVLSVISDSYSLQGAVIISALNYLPPDPILAEPDLAVSIVEFPAILQKNKTRAIGALRIRANSVADSAAIWISSDNLTYKEIYDNGRYVTGGILLEDIVDDIVDITTGPVIYALGPDIAALSQSLSADDWDLGRQLWVSGSEWGFLQDVIPLGENYYRLDGLKRKQYRTTHEAHAAGEIIYIIDPMRLDVIYDPLVRDSQTIFIKSQPKSLSEVVSLSDVSSVTKTLSIVGPTSPTPNFTEIPTGVKDGVNATFTLSMAPNPASSLMLFLNGVLRTEGPTEDYTISGLTLTMLTKSIPYTGDAFIAKFYQV